MDLLDQGVRDLEIDGDAAAVADRDLEIPGPEQTGPPTISKLDVQTGPSPE
jgi:hypothetical protein